MPYSSSEDPVGENQFKNRFSALEDDKLIQWNCRCLKANFNELFLLHTGPCPSIICLQETFLKPSDNLNIRRYALYNHIHQAGDRASGGSSIIINNSIPRAKFL